MAFSAQPPDLHRLSFGRQSFAAVGPLALGFTWIVTTYSLEDSHLQVTCHAGIGIGEDRRSRSFPSHTTRHAGPHLAVR